MGATAQKSDVPVKRIRDLLALTKSPNPHEAARARERATELMRRHGVTEADLVEEAVEVAPLPQGLEGNQRQELARIVALSRGVALQTGPRERIAFKGYPEAAKDARELFCALVSIVEGNCEYTSGYDSDRFLYRTCFWLGFVEGVQRQLDPEHAFVPPEALPNLLKNAITPPVIERAAQAFNQLANRMSVSVAERLKQAAHAGGLEVALRIPIPQYRGKR